MKKTTPPDKLLMYSAWGLIVLLLFCSQIPNATSQQASALGGQLIPPQLSESSTPVYITISMSKLLHVDTVDYRFELIMDVITSWDDPRTETIWKAGRQVSLADLVAARAGLETCDVSQTVIDQQVKVYNVGAFSTNASDAINQTCRSSIQNPLRDNCSRYCMPSVYPICCDAVWIPAIDISEVVSYPQERFVRDTILPMSAQGIDNDTGVIRQTRVHAIFSGRMSFLRFPFDRHFLEVEFMAMGTGYHLVASGISRNRTVLLSKGVKGMSVRSDELARWKVIGFQLSCSESNALDKNSFEVKPPHRDDPLLRVLTAEGAEGIPKDTTGNDSCTLLIEIERLHFFYGWNLIFPMLATVSMSFAVFFVEPTDIGTRLSTTTTLFLALTALQFVTNTELPTSSYLTAFHKLIIMSYFVIIFIIVQNLAVHFVASYEEQLMRLKKLKRKAAASQRDPRRLLANSTSDLSFEKGPGLGFHGPQPIAPSMDRRQGGQREEDEEGREAEERGGGDGEGEEAAVGGRNMGQGDNGSRLEPILASLRRGMSSVRFIKSNIEEQVTEGRGYKVAYRMDRVCAIAVPLIYWIGAILIFQS